MDSFEIKTASNEDLEWINKRYDEVGFIHSKLDEGLIAIASFSGEVVGLGRLVRVSERIAELGGMYVFPSHRGQGVADHIVRFLLAASTYDRVYCLPFSHLKTFYLRFGFRDLTQHELGMVPKGVLQKHVWCNRTYDGETLLLVR